MRDVSMSKIQGILWPTLKEREALKLLSTKQIHQGLEYQQSTLQWIARNAVYLLSPAVAEAREITEQKIADLEAELARRSE